MPETKHKKKIEANTDYIEKHNTKARIMADAEEKRRRKYLAYLNYQNGIGQAK